MTVFYQEDYGGTFMVPSSTDTFDYEKSRYRVCSQVVLRRGCT